VIRGVKPETAVKIAICTCWTSWLASQAQLVTSK